MIEIDTRWLGWDSPAGKNAAASEKKFFAGEQAKREAAQAKRAAEAQEPFATVHQLFPEAQEEAEDTRAEVAEAL